MNFYKPFFKKIVYLNEVLVKNYTILKFKHKKWLSFIISINKQLIKNKFNKFKLIDQEKLLLDYYSNKINSYKLNYKFHFINLKRLKIIYFSKLKKILIFNFKNILNLLERRIDVHLVRSKFSITLREAKNILIYKYVFLNNNKITIKSFLLNSGDFLRIKIFKYKYKKILINCFKWNPPYNNTIINYKAREILFINLPKLINLFYSFPCYLYLNKIFL